MKFMKLDTPALIEKAAGAGAGATHKHNDTVDHGGYIYLDEMLDKTFLTDYFLH
jgi:hypothetical protein